MQGEPRGRGVAPHAARFRTPRVYTAAAAAAMRRSPSVALCLWVVCGGFPAVEAQSISTTVQCTGGRCYRCTTDRNFFPTNAAGNSNQVDLNCLTDAQARTACLQRCGNSNPQCVALFYQRHQSGGCNDQGHQICSIYTAPPPGATITLGMAVYHGHQSGSSACVPIATVVATPAPSSPPSPAPSRPPTAPPSRLPTRSPSGSPTRTPTLRPTTLRPTTASPTVAPSARPTVRPSTGAPAPAPTARPSEFPTHTPTLAPRTANPTFAPATTAPTVSPTRHPTTDPPTAAPTSAGPTPTAVTSGSQGSGGGGGGGSALVAIAAILVLVAVLLVALVIWRRRGESGTAAQKLGFVNPVYSSPDAEESGEGVSGSAMAPQNGAGVEVYYSVPTEGDAAAPVEYDMPLSNAGSEGAAAKRDGGAAYDKPLERGQYSHPSPTTALGKNGGYANPGSLKPGTRLPPSEHAYCTPDQVGAATAGESEAAYVAPMDINSSA
eukprot:m.129778 g.129778  ORF g.129778 m.129778 type:complete len:493 (+) comp13685_c0_seq1:41-1519(+)